MIKLDKSIKFNKKGQALYIDVDEKYHFIVGEMLKNKIGLNFASSIHTTYEIISKTSSYLDTIILCLDGIDHAEIVNTISQKYPSIYNLILVSSEYDAIHMYDLVTVYGAADFITKPFSKQGIFECYQMVKAKGIQPFRKRLLHDLAYFNEQINVLNVELDITPPIELLKLIPLDQLIQSLMDIKLQLESQFEFSKSARPNILFIDDEKNIIDVYQNFVEDKPFNSFFSQSLTESRQVLEVQTIDIIILDLGLPDGHGVSLLKEIYLDDCCNSELPDVIVISSYYEKDTVIDVINAGAKVFINKPMTYKKFISVIYQLTFLRFMRKELNKSILTKKINKKLVK